MPALTRHFIQLFREEALNFLLRVSAWLHHGLEEAALAPHLELRGLCLPLPASHFTLCDAGLRGSASGLLLPVICPKGPHLLSIFQNRAEITYVISLMWPPPVLFVAVGLNLLITDPSLE